MAEDLPDDCRIVDEGDHTRGAFATRAFEWIDLVHLVNSEISAARLQAELARRQRRAHTPMRRRDRLVESAKALSAEIAALGGSASGFSPGTAATAAGRRRRDDVNLVQALKRAMDDKPMRVSEGRTRR